MPVLRIRDNIELGKNAYRILSYDRALYEEELEEGDEDAYRKMIDNVSAKCQEYYADIYFLASSKSIV